MVIQRFRPAFSGQGVQVEELCRALARRGVGSTILAAAPAGDPDSHEHLDGYDVVRLASSRVGDRERRHGWTLRFARRAMARLWRHAASTDLYHVHGLTDALYAAWLVGRARRRPLLMEMTLLGDDDPEAVRDSPLRGARLRYAMYRRCDGYVAMSGAFLPGYRRCGMAEDRLRLIPQGVDTDRFRPLSATDRAAARAQLGIPAGAEILVFVGSLVHRKGIDTLLRAWAGIAAERANSHLLLVGPDSFSDPQSNDDLQSALGALTPAAMARLHRRGRQNDVVAFMQAADVFVFPSRREGFGSVIVEAMACGVPAIVARLPGITDLIFDSDDRADRHGGVIVEQSDAAALQEAVVQLLGDAPRRARLGAAARARAVARFGFETIIDEYLEWYAYLRRADRRP